MEEPEPEPVRLSVTDELDLHTFRPSEVSDLIREYLAECRAAGILSVRIIHGKGSGTLRTGVHHLLRELPEVAEIIWPLDAGSGSWGATRVRLHPPV
jgi:DNA-nicking Smr family endonuclease